MRGSPRGTGGRTKSNKADMARTTEASQAATRKVGINVPETAFERVLTILSRYREASIAVVAIVLVIYFQLGNAAFLSSQELSVVLRDTGRFGLIAVAEVMLMIPSGPGMA
jgi:simple sugar transport system permease protein